VRILFVKTSSLGDVIHNCPAVSDVARHFPRAQIDWLVEEPFAEVAALHAAVRRVIPVAVRRWRSALFSARTWAEFSALRRELRRERYDYVLDSQGLLKSALLATLAHGPRHGFDRASAREPLAARFYDVRHAVPQALHAVERNRRLAAAAFGYVPPAPCDYGLRVPGESPLDLSAPFALLLTMTSRPGKLWPEERWIKLGRALEARGARSVLPWGDAPERARCERIAQGIGGALVPPRLSLSELARLARSARWVAGVDTGLAHLATAIGAATIGIFADSEPARTGLYGSARACNLGAPGAPPSVHDVLEKMA
jgi:heptosyltransferase-1